MNWKKIIYAVILFKFGVILGLTVDGNVQAVRDVSLSVRAGLANVFENHVNKSNSKLKQVIENQNKIIDNDVSDTSIYTKSDTTDLEQIQIMDE